ncbi:YjbQ family protein [Marinobacter sp.]|uniref:YjbQ family protein n=1 Tax=Marinobacter sp. TaxID=50741 RepID=UPI0034A3B56D
MIWDQTFIELAPLPRGVHLVTNEVLAQAPDLKNCEVGLLHLFIQHTSASLALNENADPDMPAHVKNVLIGASLTLPVANGHLALGTGQGIYLCEDRDSAGGRRIVATLQGRW